MSGEARHYFYIQGGPPYAVELHSNRKYEVLHTTVCRSDDGSTPFRFSHVVRDVLEAEAADKALQEELDAIASGYG